MTHQRRYRQLVTAGAAAGGLAIASAVAGVAGAAGTTPTSAASLLTATTPVHVRDIPVGGNPASVAVDPSRRAVWVTTPQLVRISETTQKVTARVRSVVAGAVAVDPGTGTVWTVNNADGTMAEVSESTNKVIHRFPSLGFTRDIAVDTQRHTVWVISNESVLEFSEVTHRVIHAVRLHPGSNGVLGALSVDPRSGTVWAAVIPGDPRTSRTWVSQISESTLRVIRTYPYDAGGTNSAITAIDSAKGTAWLAFGAFRDTTARIEVINIARHRIVRTIFNAPVAPEGLAIDSRSGIVVATRGVGGGAQNSVVLLRESSGKLIRQIRMGLYPGEVAIDQATGNVYVPIVFRGVVAQFRL